MAEIRECNAKDFEGIAMLLRQLWPSLSLDLVVLQNRFEESLGSNAQILICAESNQEVVAFGSLSLKRSLWNATSVGYVDEMIVDQKHQGRGIGRQILERLSGWARDQGCSHVELDSAFHRKDAHAFYERMGFKSYALLFSKEL